MKLAPIVLFVYKRPEHTRRTLASLKANALASDSELFVFADGPKPSASDEERVSIEATRNVIREEQWCGKVTLVERPQNVGLAANIIDGVSTLVNEHGKVIVLEDDIVTAPSFLTYMNDALRIYMTDEKVMHIAGYSFPWVDASRLKGETYFYRVASCWGWATWARAWKHYNDDPRQLFVGLCEKNKMSSFDFGYSGAFLGQLNANLIGSVRTWAVKWYASTFLSNGLALHPATSLVNNIGFDNSGENSNESHAFDIDKLGNISKLERSEIIESKYVVETMYSVYRNTPLRRLKAFLANRVKNFLRIKYFEKN